VVRRKEGREREEPKAGEEGWEEEGMEEWEEQRVKSLEWVNDIKGLQKWVGMDVAK